MITCSSAEGSEAAPRPLVGRTSATVGFARAHLWFDDDNDATLDRWAAVASSNLFFGRFTVTLAAGSLFLGTLRNDDGVYDLGAGWLASLGLSWRVLEESDALPYVVLSASLGAAATTTAVDDERGSYVGGDFRFGATVGKTFFGWLSPYATARVFGGPIFWTAQDEDGEDEVRFGTDKFHFQVGAGLVFILPEQLDLFVEGQPGAEQGAFGGMGWRY